ncbi:MAG: TolC family protein [Fimbriiglobus sp.]
MRYWMLGLTVLSLSCSPRFYRQSADQETYSILEGRVPSESSAIGRTQVEPHPTSRLVDPTDPDRPPKPPDDAAAAVYMAKPGKFTGAKGWERDGLAERIEPINWALAQGIDPNGTLKLTQERAVEIALVNSREYQTNLENVYLSALALTLNRFEFDSRWFGRNATTYTRVGSGVPENLDVNSNLGFNRNLAAGGQLLVDFANSYVWEFSGGTSRLAGNYGVSLIQPLLRNFGRKVRLESLTQAERDTLYAVRDYARFRKQFWSNIAVDGGGYLSLLLLQQGIRNARENLKRQEESYRLNLELMKGNKKSPLDVDTVLQGLLDARQSVINAEINLQNALDGFKLQLGIPPTIAVELDDSLLNPFILVDPELEKLQADLAAFTQARNAELGKLPTVETLKTNYAGFAELTEKVGLTLKSVEKELTQWKADLDGGKNSADGPQERERSMASFKQQTEAFEPQAKLLTELQTRIKLEAEKVSEVQREASWKTLAQESVKLTTILEAAGAAQTQTRIYAIRLPEVVMEESAAIAQAKESRLDLQNRQAQVTDAWRKVQVAANQLQADFNIVANANLISDPESKNPFNISNDLSRFSVGFQFDGPLNRVAERNAYRNSLINYQRARRNYMELSDRIELEVRRDLRTLKQQRMSFEIARLSLIVSARRLDNEQIALTAPVAQNQQQTGDATLRKLDALNNLLSSRDALASTFIGYEQQRIRLLLNLEALQLDSRGFPSNASPTTNDPNSLDRP